MNYVESARRAHHRLHAAYRRHVAHCWRTWSACELCRTLLLAADAAGERLELAEDDARMAERRVAASA